MLNGCMTRIGFDQGRYDIQVRPASRLGPPARQKPPFSVEVKWDKRAAETGNLYFEVENTRQRQPSGVMSTSADWWVHVLGEGQQALLVAVPALRDLLARGSYRSVSTLGDDSNSRGLLVPRRALEGAPGCNWIELPTVESFFGEIFRQGAG